MPFVHPVMFFMHNAQIPQKRVAWRATKTMRPRRRALVNNPLRIASFQPVYVMSRHALRKLAGDDVP
jgi:hypothetical protein